MARELTRGQKAAIEAVKAQRSVRRLTQGELAELADVSERTIHGFEKGQVWPHNTTLSAIERALGWAVGHLSEVAATYDATDPGDARLLELVALLRVELESRPTLNRDARRELGRLQALLEGVDERVPIAAMHVRPVAEIDAEIAAEERRRTDTIGSFDGWQQVVEQVHDPKLDALRAEREIAQRVSRSVAQS